MLIGAKLGSASANEDWDGMGRVKLQSEWQELDKCTSASLVERDVHRPKKHGDKTPSKGLNEVDSLFVGGGNLL